MKRILFIDTSSNKEVVVSLKIDGKEVIDRRPLDHRRAQIVLPMIDALLQANSITLQDLDAIEVNPGPGSFTGLRVGITVANTLGFILKIPINGKKVGEAVEVLYEASKLAPNR